MSKGFVEKVSIIRSNITSNSYEAVRVYKKIVPRNEEDWKLETVTVEQVYTIIDKMRISNYV